MKELLILADALLSTGVIVKAVEAASQPPSPDNFAKIVGLVVLGLVANLGTAFIVGRNERINTANHN